MPIECSCHLYRENKTPTFAGSAAGSEVRQALLTFVAEVDAYNIDADASYRGHKDAINLFCTKTQSGRLIACAATPDTDIKSVGLFLSSCLKRGADEVTSMTLDTNMHIAPAVSSVEEAFDALFDVVSGPPSMDGGPEVVALRQEKRRRWRRAFVFVVVVLVIVLIIAQDDADPAPSTPTPPVLTLSPRPPPTTAKPSPPPTPSPSTQIPPPLTFRYFLAVQQCSSSSPWTIHGLWPQYNFQPGGYPLGPCTDQPFSLSAISSLQSTLATFWPSCPRYRKTNEEFWSHEWTKHGTCSIFNEVDFFSHALDWYRSPVVTSYVQTSCSGVPIGQDCKVPIICVGQECRICPSLLC